MIFLEIKNFVKTYVDFSVKVDRIIVKQYILHNNFSEVQPKSIRENTTNLILFKTAGDSFDKVYKDMVKEVMENKNDFKILTDRIWRNKYSYVYINKIDDIITNNIFEVKNE